MLQVLGDTVNAGSGMLIVRCSAVAADSAVAKVARLVEQASRQNHLNCLDHFARVCERQRIALQYVSKPIVDCKSS